MNRNKTNTFFLVTCALFLGGLLNPVKSYAAFRFVAWGDSRGTPSVLATQSNQAKAMNPSPNFTLFSGDLCDSWGITCIQAWKGYINGSSNNGIGDVTFPVRGNHDSGSGTAWSTYFNQQATANRIGATNYSALTTDLTFSFDYQNSHIVGIDLPGGGVSSMAAGQITWLDNDLKAAEARGKKSAFLFWHGPIYYVDGHSSTPPAALITVLNNHPIVWATYHGHEHVVAAVTLNSSRVSGFTNHAIEQFVGGTSGAPSYSCASGRSEWCNNYDAFIVTDVISDTQFSVSIYKNGTAAPVFQKTYTKTPGVTPPPGTPTPVPSRSPSPTPVRSSSPTPQRTPTPRPLRSPSPTPVIGPAAADVNGDRIVNLIDIGILVDNYNKNPIPNVKADINKDGSVDIIDIGLIIDYYGRTY